MTRVPVSEEWVLTFNVSEFMAWASESGVSNNWRYEIEEDRLILYFLHAQDAVAFKLKYEI